MQIRYQSLVRSLGHALGCILTTALQVWAGQVELAWNYPGPTPIEVGGYKLYYWQVPWATPASVDVGTQTTYTLTNLEAGETYYFAVTAYDRYGIRESDFSNNLSMTIPSSPSPQPDRKIITIEAESMAMHGYEVEYNSTASGGKLISWQQNSGESLGSAIAVYTLSTGTYDIIVTYFDENDGQSMLAFVVNDVVIDMWVADDDFPSNLPGATTLAYRVSAKEFSLKPGDVIELRGIRHESELARIDKIELVPVDSGN